MRIKPYLTKLEEGSAIDRHGEENRAHRMRSPCIRAPMWIALAVGSFGCATMRLEPQPSTERVVASRQASEIARFTSQVLQDGPTIELHVDGNCQLRNYDRLETTKHLSAVNKSPWRDWAAGIGAAAFLGLGIYAAADTSKTYSNDITSRTYNQCNRCIERRSSAGFDSWASWGA
jgi:hypothetical protein